MKVVIVTGASSGIGAATAIEFADAGWSVMAAGRDEGRLAEVADTSDNIATWEGDLDASEDCDELVADATTDKIWRDTMAINLDVPFYLSRAAMPHLVDSAGSIVNISSYWGLRADTDHIAYCVSKSGLIMLSRAIAKNHARDGVRVNAICPGGVDTPMLSAGARDRDVDEFLADVAEYSPNGRIAEPGEVASLTVFLASDAGRHITGTAIPLDGGLTA
jgi:NAD(P)-dependent dehydrogenase (short-subunit alcohol dehydrogenase family)